MSGDSVICTGQIGFRFYFTLLEAFENLIAQSVRLHTEREFGKVNYVGTLNSLCFKGFSLIAVYFSAGIGHAEVNAIIQQVVFN